MGKREWLGGPTAAFGKTDCLPELLGLGESGRPPFAVKDPENEIQRAHRVCRKRTPVQPLVTQRNYYSFDCWENAREPLSDLGHHRPRRTARDLEGQPLSRSQAFGPVRQRCMEVDCRPDRSRLDETSVRLPLQVVEAGFSQPEPQIEVTA